VMDIGGLQQPYVEGGVMPDLGPFLGCHVNSKINSAGLVRKFYHNPARLVLQEIALVSQ
jgi:hypothetical protein